LDKFSQDQNSNVGSKIHWFAGASLVIFPQPFVLGFRGPMFVIARGMNPMLSTAESAFVPVQPRAPTADHHMLPRHDGTSITQPLQSPNRRRRLRYSEDPDSNIASPPETTHFLLARGGISSYCFIAIPEITKVVSYDPSPSDVGAGSAQSPVTLSFDDEPFRSIACLPSKNIRILAS
jgi:hypothetical protein